MCSNGVAVLVFTILVSITELAYSYMGYYWEYVVLGVGGFRAGCGQVFGETELMTTLLCSGLQT